MRIYFEDDIEFIDFLIDHKIYHASGGLQNLERNRETGIAGDTCATIGLNGSAEYRMWWGGYPDRLIEKTTESFNFPQQKREILRELGIQPYTKTINQNYNI